MTDGFRILYGDIHNHNAHGYGVGSIERSIEIARTHLDFVAFAGHASWHDMAPMEGGRQAHWLRSFERVILGPLVDQRLVWLALFRRHAPQRSQELGVEANRDELLRGAATGSPHTSGSAQLLVGRFRDIGESRRASRICPTLLPARLPRPDDPDCLCAISSPPQGLLGRHQVLALLQHRTDANPDPISIEIVERQAAPRPILESIGDPRARAQTRAALRRQRHALHRPRRLCPRVMIRAWKPQETGPGPLATRPRPGATPPGSWAGLSELAAQ